MGVKFIKNCIVGKTISFDDLKAEGYEGLLWRVVRDCLIL